MNKIGMNQNNIAFTAQKKKVNAGKVAEGGLAVVAGAASAVAVSKFKKVSPLVKQVAAEGTKVTKKLSPKNAGILAGVAAAGAVVTVAVTEGLKFAGKLLPKKAQKAE